MKKYFKQIITLSFLVVFAVSCTPTPMSTPVPLPSETSPAQETSAAVLPTSTAEPAIAPTATSTQADEIETETTEETTVTMETNQMKITIGDSSLTATLIDNSSVDALKAALAEGPLTIEMRDYGSMEKVGSFGMDLPRNDEQITTEAGDLILYQGNAFVIYYAPNSWNFTRLGKIDDVSPEQLREILGDGDVTVTLSLPQD
jgi:hypothetical protein